MSGAPDSTQILRPSVFRCVGLSAACALIAVMLIHLWYKGNSEAWIPAVFMVLGALFFAFHLAPNAYALAVDRQGFNVTEMFTVKRYEWPVVSEFNVRRGILGYYVEFYHDSGEAERPKRVVLNETYGFKPVEMARMLNDQRKRAMETKAGTGRKNVWPSRNG